MALTRIFRVWNLILLALAFTISADAESDFDSSLMKNREFFKNFHGTGRSESNLQNPANLLAVIQNDLLERTTIQYKKRNLANDKKPVQWFVAGYSYYYLYGVDELNKWTQSQAAGRGCDVAVLDGIYVETFRILETLCLKDRYDYASDRFFDSTESLDCTRYEPTPMEIINGKKGSSLDDAINIAANVTVPDAAWGAKEQQERLISAAKDRMRNKGISPSQTPSLNELNKTIDSQTKILLCLSYYRSDKRSVSYCEQPEYFNKF